MVEAAHFYEEIRDFSTTTSHALNSPDYQRGLKYTNSNNLVSNGQWQIGVSKTGFLSAAGRCLVMQANITGKPVIIVLLDSNGKKTRIGDAIRIKQWMEASLTRKRSS
jgi:D-alanyl-D-alanine endopeptidase (penicillin-binding protein 7)